MTVDSIEQVMVVKTELFHQCGRFQGFHGQPQLYIPTLLDPANTQYLPRDQMESDPSFKQLIPYCIFQYTDDAGMPHVFRYTRGKGGGESRLRAKKSVGVGGHICTLDVGDLSAYEVGMQRELAEEVVIDCQYEQQLVGLINDDENDVGRVHLGMVHLFTCQSPNVSAREDDIAAASFEPVGQVMEDLDGYETWSRYCLEALFG